MVLNASGCRKMAHGGLEIVMRLQKMITALLLWRIVNVLGQGKLDSLKEMFFPYIYWYIYIYIYRFAFVFSINEDPQDDNYDYGDSKCKKCTWSRFPSNNRLSCDTEEDDECQFGIGFLGAKYDQRFHWVADKCYERIQDSEYNNTVASQHVVTSSGVIRHQSSTVSKLLCPLLLNQVSVFNKFGYYLYAYLKEPRTY